MSLDFVAIDFETANYFRCSPCAVGLTTVSDGIVLGTESALMRPPEGFDHFNGFNIAIHGIRPADVHTAPRFRDIWPWILRTIGGRPVVAHNASFDLGVIRDACSVSNLPWPSLRYACTLVLARQAYDLPSYSLPFVAEAVGHPLLAHHDAAHDSRAAAEIMVDLADRRQAATLDELLRAMGTRIGVLEPEMWSGCRLLGGPGGRLFRPEANPNADPHHPLFGQVIAFTGALQTMTRRIAWERVAYVGAQPVVTPSKKTTILVEGMQDPTRLRPGSPLSTKAQRAMALRAAGYPIELMGEPEFLALVTDEASEGFKPAVVDQVQFQAWMQEDN